VEEVEEEEDENDIVLEQEKCSVKTYQDAVRSLKELQEFAIQQNESDMLSVIPQAKVFVESQAAKRVNCVQKTLLDYGKNKEKVRTLFCSSVQFNLALAEICSGPLRFRLRQCTLIKQKLALAEKFSGPLRFRLRQVLLYMLALYMYFEYSGTSVHERPCSRTIRFTNKFSDQKTSRMTNGVSDYEHASYQQRLATS
jgi:hypothetical protein